MTRDHDKLHDEVQYAKTLSYILFDLIGDDGGNCVEYEDQPASHKNQRMYALVEALQARLDAIEALGKAARKP